MNSKRYSYTLYLIIATIVVSIVTQVYFNYKNYQKNRQQFINEVQISLDNATDIYFSELLKKVSSFNESTAKKTSFNTINNSFKTVTIYLNKDASKIKNDWESFDKEETIDSIQFKRFIDKIFVSFKSDSLNFNVLDSIAKSEFQRKYLNFPYQLSHYRFNKIVASNTKIDTANTIRTNSKSVYLKRNEKIELIYPDQSKAYLKRGLLGILLSFTLTLAIIASLFYLLHIIKKQKAIAEIKNDFISNITHEFKTPITTIGLALESVQNFSEQEKKEKTNEYITIGKNQLNKLTQMVEKVLETATLDNKVLLLEKKPTDIVLLLERAISKFKKIHSKKEFHFTSNQASFMADLDTFHLDNACNNLLDNACKYGGDLIEISISIANEIIITISDSGTIPKHQRNKIFDKFYRIPQGDRHDVKGFGIGLYYTKKIIEKHQGSISLLDTKNTTFKIILPNA